MTARKDWHLILTMENIKYVSVFEPFPWQVKAWSDLSFLQLFSGSAGGGKSRLAAEKIHALMLRYPNSTGLVLRKTREAMTNSTLLQLENIMGLPHVKNVVHKPNSHRFEYNNGSILAYGGMKDDKQKEQIRSIGKDGSVDFVWLEEATAFTESDFNEILARMRGKAAPFRIVMMSTNPDAPLHWINVRMIQGSEASCYFSSAKDNPANPPEYLEALNSLTGLEGKRLRDGMWCRAEGVIYDCFDYDKNLRVVDMVQDWSRYKYFFGGADSNFPLPRAGVIFGVRSDGIDLIEEYYEENSHPEDLGQWFSDFATHYKIQIEVFHDPSDPEAINKINRYPNVTCIKALNSVLPGISSVYSYLENGYLKVNKKCGNVIKYFQTYKWKNADKEAPEKKDDHLPDSIRYALFTYHNQKNIDSGIENVPVPMGY